MLSRLSQLLSKLESDFISNPNYLLLLAVFNCSLLMNFEKLVWQSPMLACVMFVMVVFTLLNYRFWWAAMVNIAIAVSLYASEFPVLPNHSNLEFFAGTLIIGIFVCKLLRPRFHLDPNLVSCIFRTCVITVYFYTGFHKLNTDFFNSCVSCVNSINNGTVANLTGKSFKISPAFSSFFQYATIFVEMILPFGLLWKKTRLFAAVIMIFFHFYLSLTVFADFSAFAVFLILGCLLGFKSKPNKIVYSALRYYVLIALLYFVIIAVLNKLNFSLVQTNFISGVVFSIGYLAFLFVFIKNYTAEKTIFETTYIKPLLLFVLLISCWSMKTYIGLGNSANLTMFSNLLTEKTRSNHFLIDTKKTKVFDFEEDNLMIVQLDKRLKSTKLQGFKLPVMQFKCVASQWIKRPGREKLSCTLIYKNDTIVINDLKKSTFSKSEWWYRYVFFRKIQPEGPNKCYW